MQSPLAWAWPANGAWHGRKYPSPRLGRVKLKDQNDAIYLHSPEILSDKDLVKYGILHFDIFSAAIAAL